MEEMSIVGLIQMVRDFSLDVLENKTRALRDVDIHSVIQLALTDLGVSRRRGITFEKWIMFLSVFFQKSLHLEVSTSLCFTF